MSSGGADPFCVYPTSDEQSEIFSVLPPVPIINANSMSASPLTDLSSDDAGIYTFGANVFQPRLATQTEVNENDMQYNSKHRNETRSRDKIASKSIDNKVNQNGNMDDDNCEEEVRDRYKQPHTYSKLTSATPSNLPLSLGSDGPSMNRDFNSSTRIHISDDAELLHNKEFTYGMDDNGFENGQMAVTNFVTSGLTTSTPLATVVEQ
jgi:hypothetical protein